MVGKTTRKILLFKSKSGKRKILTTRLSSDEIKNLRLKVRSKGGTLKKISRDKTKRLISAGVRSRKDKKLEVRSSGKPGTAGRVVSITLPRRKKRRSK